MHAAGIEGGVREGTEDKKHGSDPTDPTDPQKRAGLLRFRIHLGDRLFGEI